VEGRAIINLAKNRSGMTYRHDGMFFDKTKVAYTEFNEF